MKIEDLYTTGKIYKASTKQEFTGAYILQSAEEYANRLAKAREARLKEAVKNEKFADYGEFYFLLYDFDFFEKLKGADIVRLLYLASYMPYSNRGYVLKKGRKRLKKNECADILRLSSKAFYNFWDLCEAARSLSVNESNEVVISDSFFKRGKLTKHQLKRDVGIIRIHIPSIRHLYASTDTRAHKKLGYLYKLIPTVDIQHNIVCSNPWEESIALIEDLTISDITALLGYNVSNFSRLKDELLKFELETDGKAISFSENAEGKQRIIVNPKLFYSGYCYKEVLESGKFKVIG